jgi:hypothetical protein
MPYHEAKILVEKEFGVTFKSIQPLRTFWSAVCAPTLPAQCGRSAPTAEQRAEETDKKTAPFDAATMDALNKKALELAQAPEARTNDLRAVIGLLLKARSEDRADRELEFEREKWWVEWAEKILSEPLRRRAEEIADSDLSNADMIAAMRKEAFRSVDELQASGQVIIPRE